MISPSQAQNRLSAAPAYSPPCQGGCPVVTPVQSYVSYIAQGRFEDSLREIMKYNPFPNSCGRICFHPCEDNCRRAQVDEPISIMALKRFVTDTVRSSGKWPAKQDISPQRKERVAVIGSGPAGMTAAYDLVRLGFSVTVFEREEKAGGMLRRGILDYRLPQDILDWDLEYMISHGIELRTGTGLAAPAEVGSSGNGSVPDLVNINSLMNDGYDAVVLTVGLSASRGLPIPGAKSDGVLLAVPFLKAVNEGQKPRLGKEVLVVGGGNVAIDVARSARRITDGKVKMVCLESRDEMPAHDWEVEETLAEGIELHCSRGPNEVKIDASNGRITGLEIKEVECVFDAQGRFNPSFHEDRKHVIPCDTIIFSIGQMSELDFCEGTGVDRNERGQLIVDRNTMMTTRSGVFAGGEVAMGPGAAISAIANGHMVAAKVAEFLGSEEANKYLPPKVEVLPALPEETAKLVKKAPRAKMPARPAEDRIADFDEIESGLSRFKAVLEAQRCMNCAAGATVIGDRCTSCLTCVRVCPYEVPVIRDDLRVAEMDAAKCQSCGICAAECPANAIEISLEIDRPGVRLFDGGKGAPSMVGFFCQYGAYMNPAAVGALDRNFGDVELIPVMCTGRMEEIDVLRAFEAGAEAVFAVSCPDVNCRNNHGSWRFHKRADRIGDLLEESGIGRDRFTLFATHPGEEGWAPMIAEVQEKLAGKGGAGGGPDGETGAGSKAGTTAQSQAKAQLTGDKA